MVSLICGRIFPGDSRVSFPEVGGVTIGSLTEIGFFVAVVALVDAEVFTRASVETLLVIAVVVDVAALVDIGVVCFALTGTLLVDCDGGNAKHPDIVKNNAISRISIII